MGLKETVKSQANQLAEKAQQAGQVGQAKIAELQAKRKADAMLLELGGIVYREQTGRADPTQSTRAAEIVKLLQEHEAEHGSVVVAGSGTAASSRVADTSAPPSSARPSSTRAASSSSSGPASRA